MRLRTKVFELYPGYYGSLSQLAHAMGMSVSQISRVRSGKRHINEAFILGALGAFPQLGFSDLFYLGLESDGLVTEEALRESEERYRAIFEQAADAVVLIDAETGAFVEFNDKAYQSLGYTREEFGKLRIADFEVIESAEEVAKRIDKIVKEGADSFETKHRTKGGEIQDVQVSARAISLGGRCFIQTIWRDVTERKQVEEALREAEERYRAIFEQAADSVVLIDAETGAFVEFNGKAYGSLGYSREEFGKLRIADFEVIESAEEVAKRIDKIVKDVADIFETKHRTKGGEIRDIQVSTRVISIRGRKFIQGIWRDITERKRAEEALAQASAYWQDTFDAVDDLVMIIDEDFRVVKANEAMHKAFPGVKVLGAHCYELLHGTEGPIPNCASVQSFSCGEATHFELCEPHLGGRWFDIHNYPIKSKDGRIQRMVHVVRDITERKQAEEALRESEEKLRRVFEFAADAIAITDLQGVILDINEKALEIYGVGSKDKALGKDSLEFVAPRDHEVAKEIWRKTLKQGSFKDLHYTIVKADGSEVPGEISGSVLKDALGNPVGFIAISRDITERKRTEEALQASEEKSQRVFESATDLLRDVS